MVCFLAKDFFFTPKMQKSVNDKGRKNKLKLGKMGMVKTMTS